MMKWIWSGMLVLSVVIGFCTGRIAAVSQAALGGAADAVALFLILLGTICMWNGLMKIAEYAGITGWVSRLLSPVTRRLFPDLKPGSEGMEAVTANLAANFLGLGNAATPLGLRAMKLMAEKAPQKGVATDSMAMFLVMNTASLQLVPATIAALRMKYGSKSPFEILPCTWIASFTTLTVGILLATLMSRRKRAAGP